VSETKKTLIVMSENAHRNFLAHIKDLPTAIQHAGTVEAARQALAAEPDVDLIIVDDEIPDGDWRDVAEAIKRNGVKASLLICTKERGDKEMFATSREINMPDILQKPFAPAMVRERVEAALRQGRRGPTEGASVPSHPATPE